MWPFNIGGAAAAPATPAPPLAQSVLAGPQAPAAPQDPAALKQGWMEYLQRPEIKAGLMQFAANILQPIGPGQSFVGQLGQSLGAAGQAVGRAEATSAAKAQQETENLQRQQQIDVSKKQAQTAEAGLEVDRERTRVLARGQDVDRQNTMDRIAAETKLKREEIQGLNARLEATIAGNRELAEFNSDSKMWEAAITAAANAVDPLLYATPEELQAAQAQAMQNAINSVMQIKRIRTTMGDPNNPEVLPDATIQTALAQNPSVAAANLRLMGVSEERISANMPKAPPAAPGPEQAPTAPPETAPAAAANTTPPIVADQPGFNLPASTAQDLGASFEAQAEAEREAARKADPLGFALDNLRNVQPGSEAETQATVELKTNLGADVNALPAERFARLYLLPKAQAVLYEHFGKDVVEGRATQLKLNSAIYKR